MNNVFENLQRHLQENTTFWVGYSGGLDSTVLLHYLMHQRQEKSLILRAVHIHHGLNSKADQWQTHCEHICQQWNIELITHKIDLSDSHENIEARARELRYQFFSSLLNKEDYLLTGHHQEDQAETVLLQLLRGAGPKGLSAMPIISVLGRGKLLRPFLNISRDELLKYAQKHQLIWMDDDSNYDTRFTRNFIRQEIMPLLKQRWPKVSETIARSAKHCAETEKLLEAFIAPLYQSCEVLNEKGQAQGLPLLSVTELKKLNPLEQKHVFRYWLFQCGFSSPNELKLKNCLRVFLTARPDRHPMVTWGNVIVRRYKDRLRAEHIAPLI